MTSGTTEPTPTAPDQVRITADQYVAMLAARGPQLSQKAAESRDTLATLWATCVPNQHTLSYGIDRNTALAVFGTGKGWNAQTILDAYDLLIEEVGVLQVALINQYETSTGSAAPEQPEDVATAMTKRFEEENAEHEPLVKRAQQVLGRVMEISGKLGITNPDPGLKPPVPVQETAPAEKPRMPVPPTQLWGTTILSLFMTTQEVKPEPVDEPIPQPAAGWTTPPVLTPDNQALKALSALDSAMTMAGTIPGADIKSMLSTFGFDITRITEVLFGAAELAREQLRISEEALRTAAGDYADMIAEETALNDLWEMADSVLMFFFPDGAPDSATAE